MSALRGGVTVVLDCGGGSLKVGIAGEAEPRWCVPNLAAKPKGEKRLLLADEVSCLRDVAQLALRRPVDRGFVVNTQLQRDIWERVFKHLLKVNPAECSLLVTEPLFNLPALMASFDELMYDHFGFTSTVVVPAAVCAVLDPRGGLAGSTAAQKSRCALVLDLGFSATYVVPVFDGRVQWRGVRRINLGGKALTNVLKELVSYRSMNVMDESYLMELVKDRLCYVSAHPATDMDAAHGPRDRNTVTREFVLPDGVTILRGFVRGEHDDPKREQRAAAAAAAAAGASAPSAPSRRPGQREQEEEDDTAPVSPMDLVTAGEQVLTLNLERFMVPEALFHPSVIGSPQAGLAETALAAVNACGSDIRGMLWSNVMVVGGGANCPGLVDRLTAELRPLVPDTCVLHVSSPPQPERSAWRGASVMGADVATFSTAALTRHEYMAGGGSARDGYVHHGTTAKAPPGRICKPFVPDTRLPADVQPHEALWVVRATGEVFRDYEAYLARVDLLRRRDFTCSCSGKTGLTYEEALLSEARCTENKAQLPGWLQAHVLRDVQHSTATLDALAQSAVARLTKSCVPGECCTATVNGQAWECTVVRQVDRPVGTPSPAGSALAAVADDDDDVPPGYDVSLMPPPRAAPAGPSPWLLVSNNTAGPSDAPTAVVHLSCVTRQPGLFPLDVAQLRLLITQSAACRVATNPVLEHISLWVVHPHLAAAHGITSALPPGVTLIDDGSHTSLGAPPFPQSGDDGAARGSSPPRHGSGAAPSAQRPRKLPARGCDAWLRLAAAGQIAGVHLPTGSVTPEALAAAMGPARTLQEEYELVKPGTVKAALFSVLIGAGTAGLTIPAMIAATQAARLRDWSGVANPRNSVVNCCLHDPTFVRVADNAYALRCNAAQPAWPPPPPRAIGATPAAGAGGAAAPKGAGDSPGEEGDSPTGWPAAIGRDASTTSCDVASASAEVVKCIKAERQARSAVAALQHRMDVATKSLGHAKAAAAAAVEAAASATPSPPSAPGSTDSRQGRGGWPHLPPLELPLFEGSPGDRKAVVAHKRAVEAARVAYAEALEAAASAERAAKRAKRTDKADAARPSAVTAVAVQRPSAAQMVEETASAAERGTADVDALRAQLNEAAAALAAAERATDAVKRALSAAQATAAQASAAAAVSVQQPVPEPKAIEATLAAPMDEDARPAIPPAVQLVPQPGPLPGPPPPDVAWHSGAAGPSAPSLWGAMLDAPPPGFWPVLSLSGGYEGSQFPPPPPGEEHPLAM